MTKRNYSKYHAKKTVVDGIMFDSTREARRYQELKAMEAIEERTGHWLRKRPLTPWPICSECGVYSANESNYCSNCGCKMEVDHGE